MIQPTQPTVCSAPLPFIAPTIVPIESIQIILPGQKLPNISAKELKLLRQKQSKLAATSALTIRKLSNVPNIQNILNSTLIFGQHEAGTAVCISPDGHLLTCSHCYGDDIEEFNKGIKKKWLLLYSGVAVLADCRVWDGNRDLALLKIVAIECSLPGEGQIPSFPYVPLFKGNIKKQTWRFCGLVSQVGMNSNLHQPEKLSTTSSRFPKAHFRG